MIDSLQSSVLGFQGVIAADGTLCVKKISQLQQGRKAHVGAVVILQGGTELLVDHPVRQYAVRPIRQRDNDVLRIELAHPSQDTHLVSI
jgi:hypothetical protein